MASNLLEVIQCSSCDQLRKTDRDIEVDNYMQVKFRCPCGNKMEIEGEDIQSPIHLTSPRRFVGLDIETRIEDWDFLMMDIEIGTMLMFYQKNHG